MAAKHYAKALFNIMAKEGLFDPLKTDMANIRKIMSKKTSCDYMADRKVSKKDKMDVFLGCHPLTRSFVNMVIDNKREKELYKMSREYIDLLGKKLDEVEVEARSPIALTHKEKAVLKEKLEKKLKKRVNISFKIDKGIIGGLYLKYNDNIIDGTVKGALSDMYAKMTG